MKLTNIKVENFKRIQSADIALADVNILVGTNGCGKSSLIQAVHLASCLIRQADRVDSTKTSTVGIDELDYLPSNNYKMLGSNAPWGNKVGTPSSKITFTFSDEVNTHNAWCEMRSARNAGISITGSIDSAVVGTLRNKEKFFSSYIPGVSGIPNREEKRSRKVVLKSCSYGDSNVILRNALLLLKQDDDNNIKQIEDWMGELIGDVKIHIKHDEKSDLEISCDISINGVSRPIELIGAGYIQMVQIFCYILLFNPGVLLIDEPDIHLHPTVQENLTRIFTAIAASRGIRIIITTHSPFIIRGASQNVNTYWVHDGQIEARNRSQVELALGWGAFGKKVLIVSEDQKNDFLKKIISQWPEVEKFVGILPGTGYKKLITPEQSKQMYDALGGKFDIIVHRDRDSLTDEEVENLERQYRAHGAYAWFPEDSDIEAYFCSSTFVSELAGCSLEDAQGYIDAVYGRHSQSIQEQFAKQRQAHNEELYKEGGSPRNDNIYNVLQNRKLKGAKGKFILKQLKNVVPRNGFSEEKILSHNFSSEVAADLKRKILGVIS